MCLVGSERGKRMCESDNRNKIFMYNKHVFDLKIMFYAGLQHTLFQKYPIHIVTIDLTRM